jgi:membrane protease YdiL (CAAX protease family)
MTTTTMPASKQPWIVAAGQLVIMIALAAVLLPAITPGAAVKGDAVVKLLFLGRILVLLVVATWFLRMRGLKWADAGLRRPKWLLFGTGIPLGLFVTIAAVSLLGMGMARAGFPAANYSMFAPIKGDLPQYLFWLLPVTWGSAALGEELIFRGFMLGALEELLGGKRWYATVAAIVLQAILFGVLHLYQGVGGAATAGLIGLVFGFVWLFTGRNLWAGIIIHGLIDSAGMTAIYLGVAHH